MKKRHFAIWGNLTRVVDIQGELMTVHIIQCMHIYLVHIKMHVLFGPCNGVISHDRRHICNKYNDLKQKTFYTAYKSDRKKAKL